MEGLGPALGAVSGLHDFGLDSPRPARHFQSCFCRCLYHGRLEPHPSVLEALGERGVEVEAMPTGEAVERYGQLDPQRTAAALHLTC